ncbi:diacylglycerol kinase, partial [Paenibacillus sepulcri]|nr:diacylglycerol kinase [Paenibacillus sepulcri]
AIHPLAKAAKDTASGAVLVAAIAAVVIGLIIFCPHIWDMVYH